jgi:hypothetical protein
MAESNSERNPNGLISRNYLTFLFERCPLAKTPEDWVALLPWNVKK